MQEFSLKSIIEDFPEPIAILDGDGSVRYLNAQFVKVTGFNYFELMSVDILNFFKPRISENSFDIVHKFFRESDQLELEIPHFKLDLASGEKGHFYLNAKKVDLKKNVYIFIQFRNVENKILLEIAELEHLKTLDHALFKLSHGIRNPLALCMGIIDLLENPEQLTQEEIQMFLDKFKETVQNLDKEIREMNQFLYKNKKLVQKISE